MELRPENKETLCKTSAARSNITNNLITKLNGVE